MSWRVSYCCFCFPLRTGLLTFGYLKLVLNYVVIISLMFQINDIFTKKRDWDPINYIELSLAFAVYVIDFIFNMIMIAGLHKNSIGLLSEVRNYYVFVLMVQMVMTAFYLPLETYRRLQAQNNYVWMLFFGLLLFSCIGLVLQMYFITLVRSVIYNIKRLEEQGTNIELREIKEEAHHLKKIEQPRLEEGETRIKVTEIKEEEINEEVNSIIRLEKPPLEESETNIEVKVIKEEARNEDMHRRPDEAVTNRELKETKEDIRNLQTLPLSRHEEPGTSSEPNEIKEEKLECDLPISNKEIAKK